MLLTHFLLQRINGESGKGDKVDDLLEYVVNYWISIFKVGLERLNLVSRKISNYFHIRIWRLYILNLSLRRVKPPRC